MAATLASGLEADSRVGRKMSGENVDTKTLLLATIADRLSYLVWFQTKDGRKNRNRPRSLVESLKETKTERENSPRGFSTKEDLDKALARFEKR